MRIARGQLFANAGQRVTTSASQLIATAERQLRRGGMNQLIRSAVGHVLKSAKNQLVRSTAVWLVRLIHWLWADRYKLKKKFQVTLPSSSGYGTGTGFFK